MKRVSVGELQRAVRLGDGGGGLVVDGAWLDVRTTAARGGRGLGNHLREQLVLSADGGVARSAMLREGGGGDAPSGLRACRLRGTHNTVQLARRSLSSLPSLGAGQERDSELVAPRWRDVDFERSAIRVAGSFANGKITTPKSGRGRVVTMVPEVAEMLARVGQREEATGDDDLVFSGDFGTFLDGSALRRRFVAAQKRAGLRPIRFHDLTHTFDTLAVRGAESIVELQAWMGHAEVRTTMRYTHYQEQQDAAELLASAFRPVGAHGRMSPGLIRGE